MSSASEYVIGVIHDLDIWYYVGETGRDGKKLKEQYKYSPFLFEAKRFASRDDAMSELAKIHFTMTRKILPVEHCPECGKEYTGFPAISRKDNKTEICSGCGIKQAVDAYIKATE